MRRALVAAFALALVTPAFACGDEDSPATVNGGAPPAIAGTLLFVRASDGAAGELVAVDFEAGGEEAVLASDIRAQNFGFDPLHNPLFAVTRMSGEIALFDLATGTNETVGRGTNAVVSGRGLIAYCDDANRLLVRDLTVEAAEAVTPEQESCPPMAWGAGDRLVFLAPRDGIEVGLFRFNPDFTVENVRTSEEIFSLGDISWSIDGVTLALSLADGIATVDLTMAVLTPFGAAGAAKFSPADETVLAVLTDAGVLEVYEDGELATARTFDGATAYTWSPRGARIAVTDGDELTIWHWRSDDADVVARGPGISSVLWVR